MTLPEENKGEPTQARAETEVQDLAARLSIQPREAPTPERMSSFNYPQLAQSATQKTHLWHAMRSTERLPSLVLSTISSTV